MFSCNIWYVVSIEVLYRNELRACSNAGRMICSETPLSLLVFQAFLKSMEWSTLIKAIYDTQFTICIVPTLQNRCYQSFVLE